MAKILFFNGWGMDEKAVPPMTKEEGVILNYPYTIPTDLDLHNGEWSAIGWSFGAYYLNKFVNEHPEIKFQEIIAINGHGAMLGKYGIKEKMLALTIKTLTPENLLAFYKNMALPPGKENTSRDFQSIQEELSAFAANYQIYPNTFTKAYISQGDRIVPTKNMLQYFQEQNIPIRELSGPHYPFQLLANWQMILEGGHSGELSL